MCCVCVDQSVFHHEGTVCCVALNLSPLSVLPAVLPALLLLLSLCVLLNLCPSRPSRSRASSQTQRSPHVFYRHDLINQLQHNHSLVTLVAENLSAYMETMRQFCKGTLRNYAFFFFSSNLLGQANGHVVNMSNFFSVEEQAEFDPQTVRPGSRYSHVQEVQERLNFLRCDIITLKLLINSAEAIQKPEIGKQTLIKKRFYLLNILSKRGISPADVECHVVKSGFLVLSSLVSTDDLIPRPFVLARFLLKDGQLWLCAPQAKQIWKCLAENAVFLCDREACFKWYSLFFNPIRHLS